MCAVIFIDYIIISKYILANYMRNPVALDDELLKLLAAEPAVMLSFLSQLVLFILPGRNPLRFSMCVGKIPIRYITEKVPVKINWPVYWLLLGSCTVLAGIFLKRKFDARNNPKLVITYSQSTQEQIKIYLRLNFKSSHFCFFLIKSIIFKTQITEHLHTQTLLTLKKYLKKLIDGRAASTCFSSLYNS